MIRRKRAGKIILFMLAFCMAGISAVCLTAAAAASDGSALSAAENLADAAGTDALSAEEPAAVSLSEHVRGIRDFSVIEGMRPDVMSGVVWDETVKDVIADTTTVAFDTVGTYSLNYMIFGYDGSREDKSITVNVYADLDLYLYGMEGEALIPVDGEFDPMAHIVYDDPIESIDVDTSALDLSSPGDYLISYIMTSADGRRQTSVRKVTVTDEEFEDEYENQTTGAYSSVTDLGLWRLTAYMDTPADQGPYVGMTASGAPLVAGRTVAVSSATCARLGLMFGDRLMIDGHVYILEDHGGSAMYDQNWVDIFVDNPADEYSDQYNRYAEVYLLR